MNEALLLGFDISDEAIPASVIEPNLHANGDERVDPTRDKDVGYGCNAPQHHGAPFF